MNVLLAPVLYVMPELDAFFTFSRLLRDLCPMYIEGNFDGVHVGLDVRPPPLAARLSITYTKRERMAWA
jgi:hypothetical protein